MKIKLANGTIIVTHYDDGIADGVHLLYIDKDGNESDVSIDVLKDTGEARALVYKVDSDEPDETIVLN